MASSVVIVQVMDLRVLTPCSVDKDVSGERAASSFGVDGINVHVDIEM
jgi:acyl transferase domain-containing protein